MNNFWENFQIYIGEKIPEVIVKIMVASGYNCAPSLDGIDEKEIAQIEKHINGRSKSVLVDSPHYSQMKTFEFLPGHKKLLILLGKRAGQYKSSVNSYDKEENFSKVLQGASFMMKELVKSMQDNLNVAPTKRRYSEAIQQFSIYIYLLSGKAAYEVLCNNLPMPQVSTICNKQLVFVFLYLRT